MLIEIIDICSIAISENIVCFVRTIYIYIFSACFLLSCAAALLVRMSYDLAALCACSKLFRRSFDWIECTWLFWTCYRCKKILR